MGTAGKVRTFRTTTGWAAVAKFRDLDGATRKVQKAGRTEGAARQRLSEALRDRTVYSGQNDINGDTKLAVVAELWFSDRQQSQLSPSTLELYRGRIDKQIIPALGNLRLREITVGIADHFLQTVRARHGPGLARTTRSVLSGVMAFACRRDALRVNPVREVTPLSKQTRRRPRALSVAEILQIRSYLTYDPIAVRHDLPDFISVLAASGMRVGEAAALSWDCVDLQRGTIEVRATVLRLKGAGLTIKHGAKSQAGNRVLEMPSWCVALLIRKKAESTSNLVLPAPKGGLRDPSNSRRALQQALARAGYGNEHLTTHIFRKSVSTLMLQARIDPAAISDQLGHRDATTTLRDYIARGVRKTGAAEVLEVLGDD